MLSAKNIIFFFLFVHFFDIYLHQLIGLNSFANVEFTLSFWRRAGLGRVQYLIVQLDLILESLSTSVKQFDPLFFIAIDCDFWLFGLKSPALLIIYQRLRHPLLLTYLHPRCIN